MDAPHHNGPGGLLAASGVATLVSLMPTLTDIFQFISASIGAFFAILAFYKWVRKKLSQKKETQPKEQSHE
jgi:membrane protein implicated in regulation of membrane protease activity